MQSTSEFRSQTLPYAPQSLDISYNMLTGNIDPFNYLVYLNHLRCAAGMCWVLNGCCLQSTGLKSQRWGL